MPTSTSALVRVRWSRLSVERHTAQPQPICGTPIEVPVPSSSRRIGYSVSTLSRLVVPGMSNGTPQVTTTREPSRARDRVRISVRATAHIGS